MNRLRIDHNAAETPQGVHTPPATPDALTRPVGAVVGDFLGALIWTALLVALMAA